MVQGPGKRIRNSSTSGSTQRRERGQNSVRGVYAEMGGNTERRTSRRYDLTLPILVRVPTERMLDSQKCKTRDISTRGLYFVMDQDPQTGSRLDLVLTLPTEVTTGTEVMVHVLGKVLRVEPRIEDGNTRMGVAAVIERYDIVRSEAARA